MTILAAVLIAASSAHPCAQDAERLCKGIAPGRGRIAACLKSNEAKLSAACKAKRAEFREEVQEIADACRDDAEKWCKGIRPGGGRIAACLESHESDLSEACKNAGEKVGERRREESRATIDDVQRACGGDIQRHCRDVKPGAGRVAQCLKKHEDQLSSACIDELAALRR